MAAKHLDRHLLASLLDGETSLSLVRQLIESVVDLCPDCAKQLEEALASPRSQREELKPAHSNLFGSEVMARLATKVEEAEGLRTDAIRDFKELVRIDTKVGRARIERARTRFRNPLLVDELLSESRRRVRRGDCTGGIHFACLGEAVALRLPHDRYGESWVMTQLARAYAFRGNALRASGDYREAEPCLQLSLQVFTDQGTADPLVQAEILSFFASLYGEQRRFSEARRILSACVELYLDCGDRHLAGQILVKKAAVNKDAGQADEALGDIRRGIELLDKRRDHFTYLAAQHNLAYYLHEVGQNLEALGVLQANEPLFEESAAPRFQLNRRWLEGKIARALGWAAEAEEALAATRAAFLEADLGFDAALVSLDLALAYLDQGKSAELRELAEEIVPIFRAQGIHREAIAALLLLREAARQEKVTATLLQDLIQSVEHSRSSSRPENPS